MEDEDQPPECARRLGGYDLLETIGRGGMGVVWRARQQSLNRLVALKLIAAGELATPEARRRFRDEAQAAAQLRHPNIVGIHEIGEEDGQSFFSMDLLEGRTVADLTRAGPIAASRAVRILAQVAEAIQFAHERGVLHRDLKPSNLLLESDDTVRVTDFGLSRRMEGGQLETLAGDALGSPAYLAPEQARGDRRSEGPWTDVHALGAVFYEMVTGRPPFLGESAPAVLQQVLHADPISPRRLNPALPADLESVCLKCLEKDPHRRYRSAGEVARELERFLKGQPVSVRPVGPWGRALRWGSRHPAKAALAVAVTLLVLTLILVPSLAYFRVLQAERAREAQLRETLLNQARALRLGGRSGQRLQSLQTLEQAAAMPGDEPFRARLRREFIASLALEDATMTAAPGLPQEADPTLLRVGPDGSHVARGSFRGPLRLIRIGDGAEVSRIEVTPRTVQHLLDFSPDGRFIVVRHGGDITVWDWTNRVPVLSQPSWLERFSFRPDSAGVAVAHPDGSVRGFTLPGGGLEWSWDASRSPGLRALAFAPGGRRLAVALGAGRGIELREAVTGEVVGQLAPGAAVATMAWSRDGRQLAAGDEQGRVLVWNIGETSSASAAGGSPPQSTFDAHTGFVRALCWSPDGRWLASAGFDEVVRLADLRVGRLGWAIQGETFQLQFSADAARVGPVWRARQPGWLSLTRSEAFAAWRRGADSGRGFSVALDHAGSRIAATQSGSLTVWPTETMEPPLRIPVQDPTSVRHARRDALLATTDTGLFRLGTPGGSLEKQHDVGGDLVVCDREERVFALPDFETGLIHLVHRGGAVASVAHARVADAALSPDGRWLVGTSLDQGRTRLWDSADGRMIREWADEGDTHVAFSPDGRWLAQFGLRCRFRDTRDWEVRGDPSFLTPNASACGGAFSPDGRLFAAVAADSEIHLLSVGDWRSLAVLESPSTARIKSLAWSGDGSRLAGATKQGEVHLWRLRELNARLRELRLGWE